MNNHFEDANRMRHILAKIAESGLLAPSADNEHIFRMEFGPNFIRLWPSNAFASTSGQHRRVLGLISLGAVLENMKLCANELGYASDVQIHKASTASGPLAQVSISAGAIGPANQLAQFISTRCTNRRMYKGPKLSGIELDALTSSIGRTSEVRLLHLVGSARKQALKLIWRAESERFLRKTLHEEIFSSIRFDLPWTASADFALPPGALEIETPMRPFFKLLRHWQLMKPLTLFGIHHLIGLRAGWLPAWQAPSLFVISTKLDPQQGAIELGAAFQRVWLKATSLGLALQPLAASVILPLQTDQDMGASASLRRELQASWQVIVPDSHPLMVFRIGRARPPSVRAARKGLMDYMQQTPSN
jgi:hypothetical protein